MGQETTRLVDDSAMTPSAGAATDDPDVIEHEIEHTRAEMSETIDAIQERLSPEALKAQAKAKAHDATIGKVVDATDEVVEKVQELASQAADKVREVTGFQHDPYRRADGATSVARDTSVNLIETIRANPVPAALAGASLGWLLMRRSGDGGHGVQLLPSGPSDDFVRDR